MPGALKQVFDSMKCSKPQRILQGHNLHPVYLQPNALTIKPSSRFLKWLTVAISCEKYEAGFLWKSIPFLLRVKP